MAGSVIYKDSVALNMNGFQFFEEKKEILSRSHYEKRPKSFWLSGLPSMK